MNAKAGFKRVEEPIFYDVFESPELLSPEEKELLEQARLAMDYAYAPYSHFRVGAAVRLTNGKIVTGSNFENAAYGSTICAERAALLEVNNHGMRDQVVAMALIGSGEFYTTTTPISPCGACRQVMNEFADLNQRGLISLITSGMIGPVNRYPDVKMLLPHGFGPKNLGT